LETVLSVTKAFSFGGIGVIVYLLLLFC